MNLVPPRLNVDAARMALQSAVAAVAIFVVMDSLSLPHVSWAVISALYVSQQSVDGTLGAVSGRMLGTALGATLGVALVFLFSGGSLIPLRLALAALIINALASAAPGLRYGVVAAAIIVLEPGDDALEGALDRVIAIGGGSLAGALSALFVWPQSAYARASQLLRKSLADAADLVQASLGRVDGEEADVDPVHDRFLKHLSGARGQIGEARTRRRAAADMGRALRALERLWHTLIMLDRLTGEDRGRPDEETDAALQERLHALRQQVCHHLSALSRSLGARDDGSRSRPPQDAFEAARALVDEYGASGEGIHSGGLAFTLKEMEKHLRELHDAVDALPR